MDYEAYLARLRQVTVKIREYAATQLYFGLGGEKSSALFLLLSAIDAAAVEEFIAVSHMGRSLLFLLPGPAGGCRDPELAEIADALRAIPRSFLPKRI